MAGVFFRSVNEIIRANDHVRLFILRMMMMMLEWVTISIYDYLYKHHLVSFLSKPFRNPIFVSTIIWTRWILVPFHLICTLSFSGQGLLFVYIFFCRFVFLMILKHMFVFCLNVYFVLLLKNSLLINGMKTMSEAKCLSIYNNNIR